MSRPRDFDLNAVLDAAMTTFWDQGYADTSAQDLVDSTGLGRGSLYNAFGSKHGLFEAALRHYDERTTLPNAERLEDPSRPAGERIRELLLSVVAEETADPAEQRGCLVANAAMELAGRDERITEAVRRTFTRMEEALALCVEHGVRDGEFSPGQDARETARYLLNAMYGLRVLGKTAGRTALTGIVDRVLAGL